MPGIPIVVPNLPGISWGLVATIVDLALFGYFIFLAVKRKSWFIAALVLLQAVPLLYLEFGLRKEFIDKVTFRYDPLSVAMILIVSIVGSVIVMFAIPYMADHEKHDHDKPSRQWRFFLWLVLFLGAMNGLLMADNLAVLFLFWEITTLCCVLLIRHDETPIAITNSYRALWMNLIGGVAFAWAICILSFYGHSLSLERLINAKDPSWTAVLPLALLCLAGFTKAAQMPFQGWILGAMVAPTPVSALLHSSTMVKAGVYLVLRVVPGLVTGDQYNPITNIIALVGGFTFAAAAMLAISQSDGKKVLAYSTISNLGLIIVCAGINTAVSVSVGIMILIFHALSKALLFVTTGVIEAKIESRIIEDMRGLVSYLPFTATVAVIGILSMFLPPFGMLIAKWAALEAAASHPVVMVLIVLGSTFSLVFWTKWMGRMLGTRPTNKKPKLESMHLLFRIPLAALTGMVIALSLSVTQIVKYVVEPTVARVFHETGMAVTTGEAFPGGLVGDSGMFPIIIVTTVIGLSVAIPALLLRNRPVSPNSVYMCGEQSADETTLSFLSASDEPYEISVGFYYFDKIFGETTHLRWMNTAAAALMISMLVLGVTR